MHREKQLLLSRWLFIEATQTHQFISYVDRHDLYIADELCFDLMLSNTLLFNLGLYIIFNRNSKGTRQSSHITTVIGQTR